MATYKGIKGIKVVTKTSDPTASEADATVWYNSTGNALKYAIQGAAAWASGTNTSRTGNNKMPNYLELKQLLYTQVDMHLPLP